MERDALPRAVFVPRDDPPYSFLSLDDPFSFTTLSSLPSMHLDNNVDEEELSYLAQKV